MKDVDYMKVADNSMQGIRKGAFLTVKAGDDLNTMTIGWATFGVVWKIPILMVAVRLTRHTFGLIEKAADFTVTIPLGDMSKETGFCGSKSGRDVDKLKACDLEIADSRKVVSPIIKTSGRFYECKIVYKSAMDPEYLAGELDQSIYPQKDYHTLYFGEILACYESD